MNTRISRRELALAALATTAMAEQSENNTPHNRRVEEQGLDPVLWTQERYAHAPLRLTFKAQTQRQAEAWQKQLRPKIAELLGGFPQERVPLEPRSVETRQFARYRREAVSFQSRPGLRVAGYLLTPDAAGPHPVMICVPGHGRGVDDIVGIDEMGRAKTKREGYQFDFALQVVEQGVAVFAIEPLAFGCRRDPLTKKKGAGESACQPAAGAALLFGETMIGWRVWDVMRAIDWITTRKELDANRVGCMGISGGERARCSQPRSNPASKPPW
jgi:hypothetical protein